MPSNRTGGNVRLIWIATVGLMVGACASPAPPSVSSGFPGGGVVTSPTSLSRMSDEEIRAQAKLWADCMWPRVQQLNDGTSDVNTIARAAAPACRHHYRGRAGGDVDIAAETLLKHRASQRTSAATVIVWRDCVVAALRRRDLMSEASTATARTVSSECSSYYRGTRGSDYPIVVSAVDKIKASAASGVTVGKPQPMPPADLMF